MATIFQPGAGASGQVLTSNTTHSTMSWAPPPPQNFVSNNGQPIMTIPHNGTSVILEKNASLDVKGSIVVNGIDLEERLSTIEQVLQIPTRDVTMEQKHPKLKQIYEQYMHELEKYKTWDKIKGDTNGTT